MHPEAEAVARPTKNFSRNPFAGFALAASFSAALTFCAFSVQVPAYAALSDDPNLGKLEQRFFQHSYPKESNEERLDRLEKMIFGEAKDGNERERLDNLVSAVPNLNAPADDRSGSGGNGAGARSGSGSGSGAGRNSGGGNNIASDDEPDAHKPQKVDGESKYPAVTAMEQKVLGKEYTTEPVAQRLARLETKVFGKPSGIEDLTDRMDRLKAKTGIDIARQAPPGSDWDDEDDIDFPAPQTARGRSAPYQPKPGDDGRSFSGRDLRQDFQKAFGSPGNRSITGGGSSGGSGSYGMGSGVGIGGGSGSYGMSPPRSFGGGAGSNIGMGAGAGTGYPSGIPTAPPIASRQPAPPPAMAGGMGLSQTVTALETEIFGKNYAKDPLPARVARLESTVFPQQSPANERTLPERINRLTSVVPISSAQAPPRVAQGGNRQDPEMDDLDFQNPQVAQGQNPQGSRNGGGLGKIINSISNFLTGGFSGGYAMPSGSLVTDPQTGLLLDQFNGNLIDPNSGMVVGRRAPAYPAYPSPGIPSFNNGFSSPYGMPFGGGGSGIRFGTGGFGFGGGMWP